MIPLQIDDLVEARVYCFYQSQLSVNTVQYTVTATTPAATLEDTATSFESKVAPLYKDLIAQSATYEGVHLRLIKGPLQFRPVFRNAGLGGGVTIVPQAIPRQVAGVVTKLTDYGGAAGRGRIYLPFLPVDGTQPTDYPSTGHKTVMTAVATQLLLPQVYGSVGNEVTLSPVLVSRKTGTRTRIIGFKVRGIWGTQRRRGDYGRPNTIPSA